MNKKGKGKAAAPSGAFEFDEFDLQMPDFGATNNDFEELSDEKNQGFEPQNDEEMSYDEMDMMEIEKGNDKILDGDYNDYVMHDDDIRGESSKSSMGLGLFGDENSANSGEINNLKNVFEGYDVSEKEGTDVKLTAEEIDSFQNLDYNKIAEILCSLDPPTRVKVKEQLLKKKFNILSVIHKEGSQDLRLVYFGVFSPRHVFHTLMCKKAVTERNMELMITIFSLKPKFLIKEIFESYEKVYQIDLETEINEEFKPMNELLLYFIKAEKYFHVVKETNYYSEAARVFHIIKARNICGLINFMVRFRHKCYKGICSEFYQRYGLTVTNFFRKFVTEDDIINMLESLHMSYLSPVYFYAKMIQAEIVSPKPSLVLPYLLIDLQYNGLETIMNQYHLLYDSFNAKKVSQRLEDGVKQLVAQILRKYELR